jgi:predicted RNA-binding protein YlxR (DUF448 family)
VCSSDLGPVRTCLGCGKKQLKSLLHRLVLDAQHHPLLDRTQTAPGRGAYLCGPGCLGAAIKKKALHRAFKGTLQLAPNNALDVMDWTRTMEADLQTKLR